MRIRTQNLVAIVPLFLGMAVVVGALTYASARHEMLWGLQEEASSLSVAMAEFVGATDQPAERLAELNAPFDRVLELGQAKYVFALSPQGERVWSAGDSTAAANGFVPPAEMLALSPQQRQRLAQGGPAAVSDVTELPGGNTVMISFSPLPPHGGKASGVLGVVIDASRMATLSRQLLWKLAKVTALAILIGSLAALFISWLLTRNVKALSRAALEVAGGDYDRQIEIGTIQELRDLSNTFNTMSSVLRDLMERTRRTLIEGEQYQTPLDLARTYRQGCWQDLNRAYGEVRVASRSIGGGHPGDLFGVVEKAGSVTVFVGRVGETRELDSAIAAAAARRAVEEGAKRWPVGDVLADVSRLLDAPIQAVRWWPGEEGSAVLTTYGAGEPSASPLPLDGEGTALLHTFPGRAGDVLHRWKRVFEKMPPEVLVENLGRTVEAGAMGTIVAIGPEPARVAEPAA